MPTAVKLLVFLLLSINAFSLDFVRGKMKVAVDENKGLFSIYYTEEINPPRWVPLIWARDPSTSLITLRINNRTMPLAVGSQFQMTVNQETNGVLIAWKNVDIEVNQRFEFLTSRNSSVSDGVRLSLEFRNLKEEPMNLDVRFLMDTYLGEQKNHFMVNNVPQNKEWRIIGRTSTSWISPRSEENPTVGLMVWLGDGATTPTRTIFANWKRLKDSPWDPSFSEGRDFNNIPYSNNDSAASIFYEGLIIPSKSSQTLIIAMSNLTAGSLIGAKIGTESVFQDMLESTVEAGNNVSDLLILLRRDREVVSDLLRKIDQGILNIRDFSEEDLRMLNTIFQQLEQRKDAFQ